MTLTLWIVISILAGLGLAAGGAWLFFRRSRSRTGALVFWGLAILLQAWWLALVGLVFVKHVILREDT